MEDITPMIQLRDMLQSDTPREWVIKASEDWQWVKLVEKNSLAQFEMNNQDVMAIVIEMLEHSVLLQEDIPWEHLQQENTSDEKTTEDSEKQWLTW